MHQEIGTDVYKGSASTRILYELVLHLLNGVDDFDSTLVPLDVTHVELKYVLAL